MKNTIIAALTIIFAFVIPTTAVAEDWSLAKDKKGVKVYTKAIAGQKLKAFRGETTINAEIRDVAALFHVADAYKDWLADVSVSKMVREVSNVEQYVYLVQKLPMIKDRDVVVRGKLTQDPQTKVLTVNVEEATDMIKVNSKYVRMPRLRSTFTFTPSGPGQLDVTYQVEADPGGKIPKALANSFAVKTPYATLLNLRKISASLDKYVDPDVDYPFVNASR